MVFVPKVSVWLRGLIGMNIPVFHRGQREWKSTERRVARQSASAPGESYPCEPREHRAEGRLASLLQLSWQVLCLWTLSIRPTISSQNAAKFTYNLVNIHNFYYIWFLSIHKSLKVTQRKNFFWSSNPMLWNNFTMFIYLNNSLMEKEGQIPLKTGKNSEGNMN